MNNKQYRIEAEPKHYYEPCGCCSYHYVEVSIWQTEDEKIITCYNDENLSTSDNDPGYLLNSINSHNWINTILTRDNCVIMIDGEIM